MREKCHIAPELLEAVGRLYSLGVRLPWLGKFTGVKPHNFYYHLQRAGSGLSSSQYRLPGTFSVGARGLLKSRSSAVQ